MSSDSESSAAETLQRQEKSEAKKKKAAVKRNAQNAAQLPGKRGVVFLSRLPPFIKVAKIKHLLSQFGDVTRIYAQAEDKSISRRREKHKSNHKKMYTHAWAEFAKKRHAKRAAEDLNNTQMGGPKRARYREDIWNIQYLSKFKWRHLTEQLDEEQRVRELRLREEMTQQNRENAFFLEKVNQSKMLHAMLDKKQQSVGDEGNKKRKEVDIEHDRHVTQSKKVKRTFNQTAAIKSKFEE